MSTAKSARSAVRRMRDRSVYDRAAIHDILDEALICHVGFVVDGGPRVIPTIHARVGDTLYLHGAPASFMLGALRDGCEACVSVSLVDGLVLARSQFHHSVNYRSVCLFGPAIVVTDRDEKLAALAALMEHAVPGRGADARPPSESELRAVLVVALPIHEASAKVRTGPPIDDAADVGLPIWAGVMPLRTIAGRPIAAPDLPAGITLPGYTATFGRPTRT